MTVILEILFKGINLFRVKILSVLFLNCNSQYFPHEYRLAPPVGHTMTLERSMVRITASSSYTSLLYYTKPTRNLDTGYDSIRVQKVWRWERTLIVVFMYHLLYHVCTTWEHQLITCGSLDYTCHRWASAAPRFKRKKRPSKHFIVSSSGLSYSFH